MERIGVYGGSFDPPHTGHVQAARYAVQALGLDALFMIPSCQSPNNKEDALDAKHRLKMVELAIENDPLIHPSDLEMQRGGISYTYETILQIKSQCSSAQIFLLMGSDMFLTLHNWKAVQTILQNATIAVFFRGAPGETEAVAEQKRLLEEQGGAVQLLENPIHCISSTDLRRLLQFHCADGFLDSGVAAYIRENKLYATGEDLHRLPMEQLEPSVVRLLKPNRVKHVLGCRDTAVELARHWGADVQDAARAGLLHDITKALDGPLQLTLCREYGIVLDTFSAENPKTLHALTGSLVADRIFGENAAVIEAIRWHTTGKANMNLLEKIIYVADYMEPNRDFPGVERLRSLAYSNIDKALKLGLEMTLQMLRQRKADISPASAEALAFLQQTDA